MRIPTFTDTGTDTVTDIRILSNLFVKEKLPIDDIEHDFRYEGFEFINCTTSKKILPRQALTKDHSIYHPKWGLFNNDWKEVNPYNVTVALKRLFSHIKLNQIIYIFDYDEDEDSEKYIKAEQARIINMIDKWNFMNNKKEKDWIHNVEIGDVELITNRDDASLTVIYILKYKLSKTADEKPDESPPAGDAKDPNFFIKDYQNMMKMEF